jgi:hypothetical protein
MQKFALVIAVVGAVAVAATANAALIDLQFQNTLYSGPPPVVAHTGAAVLGLPGDVWNQINNPACPAACSVSNVPLFDSNGSATGATLGFTGAAFFSFRPGGGNLFAGSLYEHLLTDGIYTNPAYATQPAVIELSGLLPDTLYDLVLYSVADGSSAFVTQFTVGGQSQSVQSSGTTALVSGDNYARLAVTSDPNGDIDISMTGVGAGPFGFLNAIQLEHTDDIPEPGSLAMIATALVGLAASRRRRAG